MSAPVMERSEHNWYARINPYRFASQSEAVGVSSTHQLAITAFRKLRFYRIKIDA